MTDYVQPNYNTDVGPAYPGNIDLATAALAQRPLYNRLINGDWQIDQMNEGALYTCSGATVKAMDGWSLGGTVASGVFKARRVADPDFASQKALELTCTTADASIISTDTYIIWQAIEGYNVADLRSGLPTAGKITVMFDMKFSVTGVYGVSFCNQANNRFYVATVTQNVANARETKIITLTLDTTGTWAYDNTIGLQMFFTLAAGSAAQGTAGVWGASNILTTASQANFMSSTSNIGYIGPIRLVPGVWPNSLYASETYDDALRRCQRYLYKTFPQGTPVAQNSGVTAGATAYTVQTTGAKSFSTLVRHPVSMRTLPSVISYNPQNTNAQWRNLNLTADSGAVAVNASSADQNSISCGQVAGDTIGNTIAVHQTYDARLS